MKTILRVSLLVIIAILITLPNVFGQAAKTNNIPAGSYLVIGAFNFKKNANGFANYVKKMGKYEVKMAYYPVKKYYYVYIKSYGPNENGRSDVKKMRAETEFIDTWLREILP